MPPVDAPSAQSWHTTSFESNVLLNWSEFVRQLPRFLKSHQAGIAGACESTSMTITFATTCSRSPDDSNESTSSSLPEFVSQANVRLLLPVSSPRQLDHASLRPGAALADDAIQIKAATRLDTRFISRMRASPTTRIRRIPDRITPAAT